MSRKDYELIAAALFECKPWPNKDKTELRVWQRVVTTMTLALENENPESFDNAKFMDACKFFE